MLGGDIYGCGCGDIGGEVVGVGIYGCGLGIYGGQVVGVGYVGEVGVQMCGFGDICG